MRYLLPLLAVLLLAVPTLAQPLGDRGRVHHVPTARLPTCDATTEDLWGTRLYDVTADDILLCDETAAGWVVEAIGPIGTDDCAANGINSLALSPVICTDVVTATFNPVEGGDRVVSFFDSAVDTVGNENNVDEFMVPYFSGEKTISMLSCEVDVDPGGGESWTITVQNGPAGTIVNSTLSCDIVAGTTECDDRTSVEAITAANRERIILLVSPSAVAGGPAPAAEMNCSICLGP